MTLGTVAIFVRILNGNVSIGPKPGEKPFADIRLSPS